MASNTSQLEIRVESPGGYDCDLIVVFAQDHMAGGSQCQAPAADRAGPGLEARAGANMLNKSTGAK